MYFIKEINVEKIVSLQVMYNRFLLHDLWKLNDSGSSRIPHFESLCLPPLRGDLW